MKPLRKLRVSNAIPPRKSASCGHPRAFLANPEQVAAARRSLGVSPREEGFDVAWAAELLAGADAIEAAPALYAQTERCAADIVAERFRIEEYGRRGPQPECGRCARAPMCELWRPSKAAKRS